MDGSLALSSLDRFQREMAPLAANCPTVVTRKPLTLFIWCFVAEQVQQVNPSFFHRQQLLATWKWMWHRWELWDWTKTIKLQALILKQLAKRCLETSVELRRTAQSIISCEFVTMTDPFKEHIVRLMVNMEKNILASLSIIYLLLVNYLLYNIVIGTKNWLTI